MKQPLNSIVMMFFCYLYENKIIEFKNLTKLGEECIRSSNYELLGYLEKEGMEIDYSIIEATIITGNLLLLKYYNTKRFLKYKFFSSVKSGNFELVRYIIKQKEIKVNAKDI